MKRFFVVSVGVLWACCCLLQDASAAGETKIGVVDIQRLQTESREFEKVREKLKQKSEELKAKLKKENDDLAKIEEEYAKQSMMLSLDAKETKRKELEKKKRHYKFLFEEYSLELKEAELAATRTVGMKIKEVAGAIARKKGCHLIMEKGMPGLIFFDESLDLTDEIIKTFDRTKK